MVGHLLGFRVGAVLMIAAIAVSLPAAAQKTRRVEFRGDVATEANSAVKVSGLEALKGLREVYIPQFTVEFVERSDGLSSQEEKRQSYVKVNYRINGLTAPQQQAIAERIYARWVAGLQAQGITVHGPAETAALPSASKYAKNMKPAPALIERANGDTRLVAVGGATYLLPRNAIGEVKTGAAATTDQAMNTGAAVGSKVGGKLGGMFGMAGGLMKMGKGLSGFGGQWNYAAAEYEMAKSTGSGIMTVRLVVGLRDVDMASRGFGLFRDANSYDGKPRLVIQGDASEVTITAPAGRGKTRTEISVPEDLVFQEDVLKGKIAVANSAGATVANIANRAMFATAAIGGGSAAINQSHTFAATPEVSAYTAAVERNLSAISDIFLSQLSVAW